MRDEGAIRWDGTIVQEGDLLEILFGDILCVGYDPRQAKTATSPMRKSNAYVRGSEPCAASTAG